MHRMLFHQSLCQNRIENQVIPFKLTAGSHHDKGLESKVQKEATAFPACLDGNLRDVVIRSNNLI
jgi:hypothetical protein